MSAADAPTPVESAPLAFVQQYLWFLLQYPDVGPARFNATVAVELFGRLDVDALAHALVTIEERHESLRTRLSLVKGQPAQLIDPVNMEPLRVMDVSELTDDARTAAITEAAQEELDRPLDFARGPVHRRRLVRVDDDRHVLLWTANHVNFDFWSYRLLLRELRTLYRARVEGRSPDVPPLPLRYVDFARQQRAPLPASDLRPAFWRRYLEGADCFQPPHRMARPTRTSPELTRSVPIDRELGDQIAAAARRLSCTRFSILLAALDVVAHRWTGADDVVALVASAHRSPSNKHVIGSFADMLPVRVRIGADATLLKVVRAAQSAVLAALSHELPLRRIEEATGRSYRFTFGMTDHVPFYERDEDPPDRLLRSDHAAEIASGRVGDDVVFRASTLPMRMYKMDLLFTVERELILCTYQPDLFATEAIDEALARLVSAVRLIIEEPELAASAAAERLP